MEHPVGLLQFLGNVVLNPDTTRDFIPDCLGMLVESKQTGCIAKSHVIFLLGDPDFL